MMNFLKSTSQLAWIGIISIGLVSCFHILVLVGVIPFTIVWGGQLPSHEAMLVFESVSLAINLMIVVILAHKANYLHFIPASVVRIILWLLAVLFALNTIGNLFTTTWFEKLFFTPITAILAVIMFLLAKQKSL